MNKWDAHMFENGVLEVDNVTKYKFISHMLYIGQLCIYLAAK